VQATEIEVLRVQIAELKNDNKILRDSLEMQKDDVPKLVMTLPAGIPASEAQSLVQMVQAINTKLQQLSAR
jgi:hypothetical protein